MRQYVPVFLVLGLLGLTACTDPVMEERVVTLEAEVEALQEKIDELEKRPAPRAAAPSAVAAASPEQEEAAAELLRQANTKVQDMEYEDAKKLLDELTAKYPSSRAARSSSRLTDELSVIGRPSGDMAIEKWYIGQTGMNDGTATLIVFWEEWCPHCRREVPAMQATYEKYQPQGLNVVAVTKITKSASDEKVTAFIEEHDLKFPMGKEDGSMSDNFGVRGIPAAAVVKDGKIVWRGHPARITEDMYKAWLGTSG